MLTNFIKNQMTKMVLIVRKDLNMGEGKAASQCAHAAVQCYVNASQGIFNRIKVKSWLLQGQPKIILKVYTEKEILRIAEEAKNANLNTAVIRDAGRTQLEPGTITTLGIGPDTKENIDKLTSHLRLL